MNVKAPPILKRTGEHDIKTVSDDVQRLGDTIAEFFTVEASQSGAMAANLNHPDYMKQRAADIARFVAVRFNRTELYLSIDPAKEARNRRVIDLAENRRMGFSQIAATMGISTATVYSIVKNKNTVTITGEFDG